MLENPRATSELAQFVVEAGLASADAVKNVLDSKEHEDERLALVLINSGLIASAKLAQLLSYQLCLPWVSLEHVRFSPKLLRMIPVDVALKFGVVPVHVRRRATDGRVTLYVATDDPTNQQAIQACEAASGLPVRMMVATATDISMAIAEEYGEGEPPSAQPDEELADTAPDGQKVGQVAPPAPRNGAPRAPVAKPPPPPAPRLKPDTDVAAAAARMSSPDLSAYTQNPSPAVPAVVSPLPPPAVPPSAIGPSASSPPPPRVGGIPAERSPVPGLSAAATNVAPRIVSVPEPEDEDLEELDEEEEEALPATRRIPTDPPVERALTPTPLKAEPSSRVAIARIQPQPQAKATSASEALFDADSWETPSLDAEEEEDNPRAFAPPPPPPPSIATTPPIASAPPPPGAVPPPPPPPVARISDAPAFDDEDDEVDVDLDLRDSTIPAEDVEADSSRREELAEQGVPSDPVPSSSTVGSVLLLVGAEYEFVEKCRRAVTDNSTRIVPCTLMTATARARKLKPFVIVVPEDVYGFDRFAFNKLALEVDTPLLIWEKEFEPEQVSALLSIAREKKAKLGS